MNIVSIFPPYLFSMQYGDGDSPDEFHRHFSKWHDIDYVLDFFRKTRPRDERGFLGRVGGS